jgi:hypothetical protein
MFYQSGGQADVAAQYLRESLGIEPGYAEAELYLAMVLLYGLDDPAGAVPLLQALAGRDDLPAQVRVAIEEALRDAGAAS